MASEKDYRNTFVQKGCEKKVIETFSYFGYKVETLQYIETDNEPWEHYVYAFGKEEIYDAVGAYPAPARGKPYPFPGYVSIVMSLDKKDPDFAYYNNVYRLYRRVQFDVFAVGERYNEQKSKMIMPLTFWVLYLLIAFIGAGAFAGYYFLQKRAVDAGGTGNLFDFSRILDYITNISAPENTIYGICLIVIGVGLGLIVLHILWDLIFHGIKAAACLSSWRKLSRMRDQVVASAIHKKYPNLDSNKLRQIENNRGIYRGTSYTPDVRRKEDGAYKILAQKQKKREIIAQVKRQKAEQRKAKLAAQKRAKIEARKRRIQAQKQARALRQQAKNNPQQAKVVVASTSPSATKKAATQPPKAQPNQQKKVETANKG